MKNPGKTTREYLDGNRVNHYKPILLAFVLTGLAVFITYKVLNFGELTDSLYKNSFNNTSEYAQAVNKILANYMSFFMMLLIPFAALISYIVFKKQKHNYYEHVVITANLYSLWSIFSILFIYPILYFLNSPNWIFGITFGSIPLFIPLVVCFYKELYLQLKWSQVMKKIGMMIILGLISYVMVSILLSSILFSI